MSDADEARALLPAREVIVKEAPIQRFEREIRELRARVAELEAQLLDHEQAHREGEA